MTKKYTRTVAREEIVNHTLHDLWYGFASRFVMAEIGLDRVQRVREPEPLPMALRYAHRFPGYRGSEITALD